MRLRLAILCAPILLATAGAADEASVEGAPAATAEGEATAEWIQPEEIPARADALVRRLGTFGVDPSERRLLEQVEAGLAELAPALEPQLAQATALQARSASLADLEEARRLLEGSAAQLGRWQTTLEAEAKRVGASLEELARAEQRWSETGRRPETAEAGESVQRRVQLSLEALAAAAADVRAWRSRVLELSDRVVAHSAAVESTLEKLRTAEAAQVTQLLVPERAPLWRSGLVDRLRGELPQVPEVVRAYASGTRAYLEGDPRPFVLQAALAVLLAIALRRISRFARPRIGGDGAAGQALRVLERPYSIALLLALVLTPWLHALAPRRVTQLLGLVAIVPGARIVVHASERSNGALFVGLFVLLLLDRLGLALESLPALARATFHLGLLIAFGLSLVVARRTRSEGGLPHGAARLVALLLLLTIGVEIGGWGTLAGLIGRSIIGGVTLGLALYAAVISLEALLVAASTWRALQRVHSLGRNAELLRRRATQLVRWLGVGLWLYLLLQILAVRDSVSEILVAVLQARLSVGALSLSVGGVVAFVLTLAASVLLARVVNGVFEADVYPRTRLPRGVPYALSTLVRYGFYSLGFLLALAAVGVEVGQLTILIGGLGVGIGLGLQDLVKNFAAGLVLLFERRVHVGDAVQIPSQAVFGRVLAIEMRATMIRNWDGSEVVVPNADLVSGAVTNWTLSDRLRRIEVPVGVAYGTVPQRVLAVLLEAARDGSAFVSEPPPQALFKGFGESSLDFVIRAWTDEEYERTAALTSELALAVHRRLEQAGISIPFPHRDVHVASVSPEASDALSGRSPAGTPGVEERMGGPGRASVSTSSDDPSDPRRA
jgi:small-conductance mechanosensitive channel